MSRELRFLVEPEDSFPGVEIVPTVEVEIREDGERAYLEGPVSLSLEPHPSGAALGGTTTRNAVEGHVSFPGIFVSRAGEGFQLRAEADEDDLLYSGLDLSTAIHAWRFTSHGGLLDIVGSAHLSRSGNGSAIGDSPIGPAVFNSASVASGWTRDPANILGANTARSWIALAKAGESVTGNRTLGGCLNENLLRLGVHILENGNAVFRIGSAEVIDTSDKWIDGPWVLYAITQAADGSGSAYVNGAKIGSGSASAVAINNIAIAQSRAGVARWTGGLAAMAIWDTVLSDGEILEQAKRCGVA